MTVRIWLLILGAAVLGSAHAANILPDDAGKKYGFRWGAVNPDSNPTLGEKTMAETRVVLCVREPKPLFCDAK